MKRLFGLLTLTLVAGGMMTEPVAAQWETLWELGAPGRGWPLDGTGGGPDVDFVQENGNANTTPGDPNSPAAAQQADDDYYFAGIYPDAPLGVGVVSVDEIAMERAFAGIDNTLRIHFNIPELIPDMSLSSLFRFSFEANNMDERVENPNPRYGVQVLLNDVLVMPEIVITPSELNTIFTTAEMSLADANAILGPGGDNVLTLQGVNYNAEGGGNWMGLDYHALEVNPVPEPSMFGLLLCGGILLLAGSLRFRKSSS